MWGLNWELYFWLYCCGVCWGMDGELVSGLVKSCSCLFFSIASLFSLSLRSFSRLVFLVKLSSMFDFLSFFFFDLCLCSFLCFFERLHFSKVLEGFVFFPSFCRTFSGGKTAWMSVKGSLRNFVFKSFSIILDLLCKSPSFRLGATSYQLLSFNDSFVSCPRYVRYPICFSYFSFSSLCSFSWSAFPFFWKFLKSENKSTWELVDVSDVVSVLDTVETHCLPRRKLIRDSLSYQIEEYYIDQI